MGTLGDVMNTMGTAARRLTETVRYTAGIDLPAVEDIMLLEPDRLRGLLEVALAGTAGRVRVKDVTVFETDTTTAKYSE